MLRNAKQLKHYTLRATDGEIGRLRDFYFDDRRWTIRYLIVEAGAWLESRRVLIAPEAMGTPEWDERVFPVDLTKEEVRNSPRVDMATPITQQTERVLRDYYGWPAYYEGMPATDIPAPKGGSTPPRPADPHLFGTNAVTGYHISAMDGEVGHVADFVIDDSSWEVSYLVVDTRNWLPGRHVLLDCDWIEDVDWAEGAIKVNLLRDVIKSAPPYDESSPASSEYAATLHAHYGQTYELQKNR